MANAEGGHVIVGEVDDGVQVEGLNALRQAAIDFTVPAVRCSVSEVVTSLDGTLLAFHVSPGDRVHETTKGEVYLRVGDESRRLGFPQRRELEYDLSLIHI